jgi:predicted ribosome quality control (RQC) complex YloA/Tae2 family protein
MTTGKQLYIDRRRLQQERRMAQEQSAADFRARQERDREAGDLLMESVIDFLKGTAVITVTPDRMGGTIIRFRR